MDEIYIEEASDVKPAAKTRRWVKWGALAACLCLVVGGALLSTSLTGSSGSYDSLPDEVVLSEDGVTIPPTKVTLGENDSAESCWAYAFFIYQGRCYKSYDGVYGDSDLIGDYLGTTQGMIDLWTPKEGYVELAGNTKGDFYSVKGYDPEFMVCMRESSGAVNIFINDNDLTLKYGSDLLEDRFHLSGSVSELVYQDHDSWNYSKGELYSLNNDDAVSDFIALLDQGIFIPETHAILPDGTEYLAKAALYHVDLRLKDGITVELRLCKGGYVSFDTYFSEVCIQVDETKFNEFITLLDSGANAISAEVTPGVYRTLDECRADPYFGLYAPSYVPDGMSYERGTIYYEIESKTGNILRTKEVNLTYSCGRDPDTGLSDAEYTITIAPVEDHGDIGWVGTLLTPEELTPESAAQFLDTTWGNGTLKNRSDITFGVQHGDVMVILYGDNLDAGEAYQIMASVHPE